MRRLAIVLLAAGCGNDQAVQADAAVDGAVQPPDAAVDASTAPFTLTSPTVSDGATIATVNTCDGANTSPELSWSGNTNGAKSFAVVMTDLTITNSLVHWVIYDIPASAAGLPAGVQKTYSPTNVMGAHQTTSYQMAVRGYLGPCPPAQDGAHAYEIAVYGLDVEMLPGTSMMTTRQQAVPLIKQHETAKATLTGSYDR
jgi:Raf kinase inhibitor-like YbhB/YbcL family protein